MKWKAQQNSWSPEHVNLPREHSAPQSRRFPKRFCENSWLPQIKSLKAKGRSVSETTAEKKSGEIQFRGRQRILRLRVRVTENTLRNYSSFQSVHVWYRVVFSLWITQNNMWMIPLIFLVITNGTLWKKIPELRGIYSKSAFYIDNTYHKSPMISIKEI